MKMKDTKSAITIRRRRLKSSLGIPRKKLQLKVITEAHHEIDEADLGIPEELNETQVPVIQRIMSSGSSLFLGLLVFRVINMLMIQTWYVPDEFWQSLEVAHKAAYGYGYLTWEWKHGIRSFSYPGIFAIAYKILGLLHIDYRIPLIKVPRLLQAYFMAVGDYYVYKLSSRLTSPRVGQWTLLCQVVSWFMFYCGTRTLTNTMETILTTIAMYYFPWPGKSRKSEWKFVGLVAASFIIRPTCAILWLPMGLWHLYIRRNELVKTILIYIIVGLAALSMSMGIDYVLYGEWMIVQLNFLQVNVFANIAVFYGSHPWHWYITQGFPVIMSGHLVLFTLGVWKNKDRLLLWVILWTILVYSFLGHKEFRFIMPVLPLCMHYCGWYLHYLCNPTDLIDQQDSSESQTLKTNIETTTCGTKNENIELKKSASSDTINSSTDNISDSGIEESEKSEITVETNEKIGEKTKDNPSSRHRKKKSKPKLESDTTKESVNKAVSSDINESHDNSAPSGNTEDAKTTPGVYPAVARWFMVFLVITNVPPAFYFSLVHQRGTIDVMKHIYDASQKRGDIKVMFLMPCHSTPYYSYLHKNIDMDFLKCEPNLDDIPNYKDDAAIFYDKPIKWLNKHIKIKRDLPTHLVIFDSLQPRIQRFLNKHGYKVCAKYFHTHFPEGRVGRQVLVTCR